jgi:DNA-directed RNA polymerase specialized sigma24 family protein
MSSAGSVTCWLRQLKAGERAASQPLWETYFRQLVTRARHQLAGVPRRAVDEEDVALSAFGSFCRAAEAGRFPQLEDRHDLWQVLLLLTDRKAGAVVRAERRKKRGAGKVLDEAAWQAAAGEAAPWTQLIGPEPSPAFAAQVAEACERLLARLTEADLRAVAVWKMEGYTHEEIAAKLGCAPRTVDRKLRAIRILWEQENAP